MSSCSVHFSKTMCNELGPPKEKVKKAVSFKENDSAKTNKAMSLTNKRPAFGFLRFLTLRIIFVDLFVQIGDLGSDVAQGTYSHLSIISTVTIISTGFNFSITSLL